MTDKLKAYRDKRDFERSAEPAGAMGVGAGQHLYVMHKHAASHDHFDLRLEQDGVLRSWALPKGPSLEPGEKRLAVEVEDHPLEYGRFEGVIPKDHYGGGTVMLWDRGRWKPRAGPGVDKLDFELHGEKLNGRWTLARMHGAAGARGRKAKNWLLIKRSDPGQQTLQPNDLSVVSGRSMDEIARAVDSAAVPDPAGLPGARPGPMPGAITPQLATLVDQAPAGEDWLHEVKFDGYRLLALIEGQQTRLLTRNGKDWTRRFPELAKTLAGLPVKHALLDGEAVVMMADGSTSFRELQNALGGTARAGRTGGLVYQVFDLLHLDGHDLRATPLLARKRALARLLTAADGIGRSVRYSDHVQGQGTRFYEQVCELGLEGMVSKHAGAAYRSGRHRSWLKVKCTLQDEFIVGGYTRPAGARSGFGSLLLGAHASDGLVYAGRVGSGFSHRQLEQLHRRLRAQRRKTSPFSSAVPDRAGVTWVRPEIVVDVEFTERTGSGMLRHPVFRGVREDKAPSEIVMNDEARTDNDSAADDGATTRPARGGKGSGTVLAGVRLTHADRVLFPEQGVTKLDLARYYVDVQDWILPHLVNRPLSLMRCPQGRGKPCFFQKHPGETFADAIPRIAIREKRGGSSDYLYVESIRDLVTLVQFGVLELHPWGSLITDVETPDTLIFDLDPGPNVPWKSIVDAATGLHERLNDLGLYGFVQATGGKGLHIVVPIKPKSGWDKIKSFAHAIAQAHARDAPAALTTNMSKAKRRGRIFIDYLRNARGSTSVARYSSRARERAPVATPLRWDELTPAASSNRYNIQNIRRRLAALKKDPWADYEHARVSITAGMFRKAGAG